VEKEGRKEKKESWSTIENRRRGNQERKRKKDGEK